MKLPVVKIPDPILRQVAKPVAKVTPDLVALAHNMVETMEQSYGIGLAAPQIGQSIQLIVTGFTPKKPDPEATVPYTILFNPKIIKQSKATAKMTEGCLSIPGMTGVVERSHAVTVTGLNEHGKAVTIAAQDMYARVLLHEVDHLNGVLFTDRLKSYSTVFYGTSDFAVPALEALIHHPQFNVVAVVTETDKPAGRGHALQASPVKQTALDHDLAVLQPSTLRIGHRDAARAAEAKATLEKLKKLKPEFQVVASYGKILPDEILDLPAMTTLNIHPSLLPLYRGPSPIQGALLAGETETGVSIMIVVPELDAGPVITMYKHKIEPDDTTGTLSKRLAEAGAEQLVVTLEEIIADKASFYEQNHAEATFTEKLEAESAKIDWSWPKEKIANFIRSYSTKPGAITEIDGTTIKILKAQIKENQLVLDDILIPGKKVMSYKDFSNGYKTLAKALDKLAKS